ncbi:uncharacterized protein N0V89_009968 [Didymosphaeria variabile]|uniref:Cyanovirin-N domain-containing protein n=1 Tax=Didymosphaeria variabile TaxID=1932322 RepID=A0A9W8XEY5_9PLEO|nr:uncharacterized protein N0V89_009968 [Didymosphaeria variabile]KAJ4348590.1 hypothetical protein N0V89_009968 [Didymosphaeria variabile]
MSVFSFFTILTMALLGATAPIEPKDITPASPLLEPRTDFCAHEPHCALITFDFQKQIELDNETCRDLKDGNSVTGILISKCYCTLFNELAGRLLNEESFGKSISLHLNQGIIERSSSTVFGMLSQG